MAVAKFTNAFVSLGGNDVSDHVRSVELELSQDLLEVTAMSATTHNFITGLYDWTLTLELFMDYAASNINSILDGFMGNDSVAIIVRPDAGVVAATNPQYAGNGVMEGYPALTGAVGEVPIASVTFRPAGALTRTTA